MLYIACFYFIIRVIQYIAGMIRNSQKNLDNVEMFVYNKNIVDSERNASLSDLFV